MVSAEGLVVVPEDLAGGEVVAEEGSEARLVDEVVAAAVGGGVGEGASQATSSPLSFSLWESWGMWIWACAIDAVRREGGELEVGGALI